MKWTPKRGNVQEQEQIEIIATEKDFQEVQEIKETQQNVVSVIPKRKKKGMVVLLFGDTGNGKTFTGLSFPSPITVIDTEFGRSQDIKDEFFRNKDIKIIEILDFKSVKFKDYDIVDDYNNIVKLAETLTEYIEDLESGKISGGTLLIDSFSDVWKFISGWMRIYYSKQQTKEGVPKANPLTMEVSDIFLWKLANGRHDWFIRCLWDIANRGVNVVLTAREKDIPDFALNKIIEAKGYFDDKDLITSQKELPNKTDYIFRMMSTPDKLGKRSYYAKCIKLKAKPTPSKTIERLTFEKIKKLDETGEV